MPHSRKKRTGKNSAPAIAGALLALSDRRDQTFVTSAAGTLLALDDLELHLIALG